VLGRLRTDKALVERAWKPSEAGGGCPRDSRRPREHKKSRIATVETLTGSASLLSAPVSILRDRLLISRPPPPFGSSVEVVLPADGVTETPVNKVAMTPDAGIERLWPTTLNYRIDAQERGIMGLHVKRSGETARFLK
jgi:hypothetical protein